MVGSFKGLKLAIVGGDKRELELFKHFVKIGADVRVVGFEKLALHFPDRSLFGLEKGIRDADIIIFPLTGVDNQGEVYAPYAKKKITLNTEVLFLVKEGALIISGYIPKFFKEKFSELKIHYKETAPLNEISVLNAIPTAEGAIQKAMELTDITLHGSRVFVLGFGRCALILSCKLKGLSAAVTVSARKEEALAYASALGCCTIKLSSLSKKISKADLIFNTIPSLVLTADLLHLLAKDTVIVDIASYPGGVDYPTALRLGLKAELMPGIPGMVAPRGAGKILADVYPPLILKIIKRKEL